MLDRDEKEMSTEEILHIIDEMHQLLTKRFQLTGGEPMVRNDIGKIINRAKSHGMFVGISTSGHLVPQRVNELLNADIVFLSLDGEEEIHNSLRGSGTYQMVMDAMSALRSKGIRFWTTTVITKKNAHSIDYILRLAKEKGFWSNYVFLYHEDAATNNIPSSARLEGLMLTDNELRAIASHLLERKRNGDPVGSSAEYFEFLLNWEDYSKIYSSKGYKNIKCWAGRLSCHINARGQLYTCGPAMGITEGTDVRQLGLEEAFRRARPIPSCNSCIHACWLEANIMFSLNIGAMWNWFKVLREGPVMHR
jgi:MoaA/NifB/PqqE/SkfB family radical SAM enzyme